ncbi:hypothetical protein DICVIV_07314 [Dictyocaulus viviparus]|uniref:Phosphoribosyltransferase domain-containing protein n=1 Tax=Dictyocaulus viviparus TaxID=29172 RepID=A0A0D8XW74_DICVI|nr:hypothetical protein DICVIV_07314 [Dictyocaulus viviparus]
MPRIADDKNPKIVQLEQNGTLVLLKDTNQILELHTILKDKNTDHSDFVFYADRLMRLVIEEALNKLPYKEVTITTPTHCHYKGIQFMRGNCGVSLCRSGEAMEFALRQCCRSIRICKMLIGGRFPGDDQRVLYARLIPDMSHRRVLLLYPVVRFEFCSTGLTVLKAISALIDAKVAESNIYLTTLFITPQSVESICNKFPLVTVITSDVTTSVPNTFAMKYFGTD